MSSHESGPKFRVAVCGAGIAGLMLAITIGKYDPSIPIDLYEAHDSIETAGAGIAVWRQTRDVMADLGLLDEFKQIFTHDPEQASGLRFRRSDLRQGGYQWYHRIHRYRPSSMHRQQMVAVLERNLPVSCTVHSKKRLVGYMEPEEEDARLMSPIRLEFSDGTSATADVLIGADGVRSVVRKAMFEVASRDNGDDEADLKQYTDADFTGIFIYRSLISAETLGKEQPGHRSLNDMTTYVGKGRYLMTYPVAKGTLVNVVAMVYDPALAGTRVEGRWVSDATRDEVVGYYDNFEPDVRELVKLYEKPSKWALHVVKPLPFCVRQRVALVGDACHAMTPHFGAGAVQAIDDAFVLGRLLASPLTTLSRVREVLCIYQDVRFAFVRTIAHFSLSAGRMCMFLAPGYYDGTRDADDVDEDGIGAHEREGMEAIRQEIFKWRDFMEDAQSAPQIWEEAASKLQALVG